MSFPHSSVGKESACNAGGPGLIPGLGRSAGEGIGYPLQYSWASLVAQPVKNPPAMWETWVRSLGQEGPLEKGKATPSSILAWRMPWSVIVHGVTKSRTQMSDFDFVKGGQQGTRGARRPSTIGSSTAGSAWEGERATPGGECGCGVRAGVQERAVGI